MLMGFVIAYMLLSIAIGLYAALRVKNSTDYVVAGRSLPLYITIATVFATWFGSEAVLGVPATFLDEGIGGVIADPFGASMCLILVGLIFARPLYRMKLLTLADFYKQKYGRTVELLVSICICLSYLGWVSAQIMAFGLVFDLLTDGYITPQVGMMIGMAVVVIYTIFGGMWSVALTDLVQMAVIVVGLMVIAYFVSDIAGGVENVVTQAVVDEKFSNFWPELTWPAMLAFIAAWITMGFGSIPQQDIFQRVMSAKNENVASYGSIIGGVAYLLFALIPIYLAYSAFIIQPDIVEAQLQEDSQYILPSLILAHTPLWIQVIFFGAVMSAIMSTASATLLAPSVTFAENIAKGFMPSLSGNDKKFLRFIRCCVLVFALMVLWMALNSEMTIFEMVESAYKVTLVGAFVPLVAGLFWKRANKIGALSAIIMGIGTWLFLEAIIVCEESTASCSSIIGLPFSMSDSITLLPPQLGGFIASIIGMIAGTLIAHTQLPGDVERAE